MVQSCALQQEFKWRELEEQRKAERLHKRLQQEQTYLLSLQHQSKQQPADVSQTPLDCKNPPQTSSLPPDGVHTPSSNAEVLNTAAPGESANSQAAVQHGIDESTPSVTETLADSKTPKAKSTEADRLTEPATHPPQPIREVNFLLGSICPAACSF